MAMYGTLTVNYKAPSETQARYKNLTVDMQDVYDAGKASGQTKTEHYVTFDVVFSDGHNYTDTKQVTANCVYFWNEGAKAHEATYHYVYATDNNGYVNARATSSGGDILGTLYANSKVTVNQVGSSYTQITMAGHTAWVQNQFVHTSPKSGLSISTTWRSWGSTTDIASVEVLQMVHSSSNYSGSISVSFIYRHSGSTSSKTSTAEVPASYANWASGLTSAAASSYFKQFTNTSYYGRHSASLSSEIIYHKCTIRVTYNNGSTQNYRVEFSSQPHS